MNCIKTINVSFTVIQSNCVSGTYVHGTCASGNYLNDICTSGSYRSNCTSGVYEVRPIEGEHCIPCRLVIKPKRIIKFCHTC